MSCMISRRNFMRCVGISALAVASSSLLGGCNQFGAEYGLGETAQWKDDEGGTFSMTIHDAYKITKDQHKELADNYQLKVEDGQQYVFFEMIVQNHLSGDQTVELYKKRYGIDWFDPEYTDESVREHFYQWEDEPEEGEQRAEVPAYPNANRVVEAPSTIWAYENGNYLDGTFGVVCVGKAAGIAYGQNDVYGQIPQGQSTIIGIGQVTDNLNIFRLVYRIAGVEVNFKLAKSDFA